MTIYRMDISIKIIETHPKWKMHKSNYARIVISYLKYTIIVSIHIYYWVIGAPRVYANNISKPRPAVHMQPVSDGNIQVVEICASA